MTARLLVTALLAGLLGACGTTPNAGIPDARPLGDTLPSYRSPERPSDVDTARSLTDSVSLSGDTLTLRRALGLALTRNPKLRSFAHEVRAREARALQAGLLEPPTLSLELDEFGGTGDLSGFDNSERRAMLSQPLPLGGDRGARRSAAEGYRDLAGWDYETARLDVFTEVTKKYVDLLATQRRVSLTDSLLALTRRFHRSVSEQVEAGEVSPLEEERASILLSNARIARDRAVRERRAARKSLAATWGRTDPSFRAVAGRLDSLAPVPALDSLTHEVQRNPAIARSESELSYRQQVVALEKARAIPDPVLRFGGAEFGGRGERALTAGIAFPLPFWDRNQGNVQKARYRLQRARAEQERTRIRIRDSLSVAYERLSSAYQEARTLSTEILPAARTTFDATREGYDAGEFDLLRLLDAQRTLVETSTRYLEALADFHRTRATVERLIGRPLNPADSAP